MLPALSLALAASSPPPMPAPAIVSRPVEYTDAAGTAYEGYVAYDDRGMSGSSMRKKPTVIIVHDYDGVTEYEMRRARQLAAQGYVAFAVDIFGKGVRPTGEARMTEIMKYLGDRGLYRARLKAGYDQALKLDGVDADNLFAIGYCFGGAGVLEMGRAGMKTKGLVAFHGLLGTPTPTDDTNISAPVLVLHGAADPLVPPAEVQAFRERMKRYRKPYKLVAYPGAEHAFTIKEADMDQTPGVGYNAQADRKSWAEMDRFLNARKRARN